MDQVLGWIATFLFTSMMIPQTVKTIRTKDIKGVSIWMFLINFVANCVALCYATMISQGPLQVKYILALIATSIYLLVYTKICWKNGVPK
jgi:uncharacterized protein with PQ loop repeat